MSQQQDNEPIESNPHVEDKNKVLYRNAPANSSREKEVESIAKEILLELHKDSIRQEIKNHLIADQENFSFYKFAQHPAVLLFLTFLFTGIVGTTITSRLQSREWDRQQDRLQRIKSNEQKYSLMNEISKAFVEYDVAAQELLMAFDPNWRQDEMQIESIRDQRIASFRDQNNGDRRATMNILRAKLIVLFNNSELLATFDQIIDRRVSINAQLETQLIQPYRNLLTRSSVVNNREAESVRNNLRAEITQNTNDLEALLVIMVRDLERDPDRLSSTSNSP